LTLECKYNNEQIWKSRGNSVIVLTFELQIIEMITFNELPKSAQKAYKVSNILRKVTMFLSIIIAVVCMFGFSKSDGIFNSIFAGLALGGVIRGIVHYEFILKAIMRKTIQVGVIGLLFGLFICYLLICLTVPFLGFIFVVVDLVLFILKKPLVYQFENKFFLNSKAVKEEMAYIVWNDLQKSNDGDNAMEMLQKLKEMAEQGVITDEEFNIKKAELLERI
jgi:hypothetical protein